MDMRTIHLARSLVPAALLGSLALAVPGQEPRPPSAREQEDLVKAYLALDARSSAGLAEQRSILARLETVGELSESDAKAWRKKLSKLWDKGRTIERKPGQKHFWEEEKRGLFIVGGETKRPKGLLIAMHGGGAGEGDAWSAHSAYNGAADDLGLLALYPQVLERTEHGWIDSGTEEFVLDLLDAALRTWDVDRNRVYFAGHSMGGYGTWTLGAHHADRLAALAPAAGAATPVLGPDGTVDDVIDGVVPNLRNLRIVIYQSDDDPRGPPEPNRVAVAKLAEARERWGGFDFEYWEVQGNGHELPPGGTRAHLDKIAAAERDPLPAKVVWQPALTWKRHFYWLGWEQPARGAILVAEADRERNEVRVECPVNPRGLAVFLDGRLVDLAREVVVTLNGAEVFRGRPARSLAALVQSGAGGDPALTFECRVPLAR